MKEKAIRKSEIHSGVRILMPLY